MMRRQPAGLARTAALALSMAAVSSAALAQQPDADGAAQGLPPNPVIELTPVDEAPPTPLTTRPPILVPRVNPSRLDLGLSAYQALDHTGVVDDLPPPFTDRRLRQDSWFSGADASLSYSHSSRDKVFAAMGGGSIRYYSLAPTVVPASYYGGMNFSAALSSRVRFRAAGNGNYSPFYSFGSFLVPLEPSQIAPVPQLNMGLYGLPTYTANGSAGLTWKLSQRASIDGGYAGDYFNTGYANNVMVNQGGTATFQYRKTKYLSLRAGYSYRTSDLTSHLGPTFDTHSFDGGVAYQRPLSASRRTFVAFSFGSTLMKYSGTRSFYVTGDASLSHQFTRTWGSSIAYHRGVNTFGGFAAPYITDVISGTLSGMWTRNFGFSGYSSYSRGAATAGIDSTYEALDSSGRVTYRLTRYMPIYVEYFYYFYGFDRLVGLVLPIPEQLQRHGLRTGLSYSVPLIGRRAGAR
jgi:hypothetical protein